MKKAKKITESAQIEEKIKLSIMGSYDWNGKINLEIQYLCK